MGCLHMFTYVKLTLMARVRVYSRARAISLSVSASRAPHMIHTRLC